MREALLTVTDLKTWFPIRKGLLSRVVGHVKAVDGVSFEVHPGETLGLVGESGCGKTTVGRTLLRLIPATGGAVRFAGKNVFELEGEALRALRRGRCWSAPRRWLTQRPCWRSSTTTAWRRGE